MERLADPSLWAQFGGITGLVIFALFVTLYFFVKSIVRIWESYREDLRNMLDVHAKERAEWGMIVDTRQKETNQAINAMTAVINQLNHRYRISNGVHHEDSQ